MDEQKIDVEAKEEYRQELEIDQMLNSLNNENVRTCASSSSECAFSLQENPAEQEARSSSTKKLVGLIIFYLLAMAVEITGGLKSNSLAVLTDAAHMFSDAAGFAISLFAVRVSGWKPTSNHTFGFYRIEVTGALISVQLIWLISGFLMYEAIGRLLHEKKAINGKVMFMVAAFGFVTNLIMVAWMGQSHLHDRCGGEDHPHLLEEESAKLAYGKKNGGSKKAHGYTPLPLIDTKKVISDDHKKTGKMNINLEGAYLHVVSDLIQSIGVMIAGAVIWAKPNSVGIDLICTSGFSVAVLLSTKSMMSNVMGILMERTTRETDIFSLENGLKSFEGCF